jgi:putative DNA primase/helicase
VSATDTPGEHLRRFLAVFTAGAERLVIELRALASPQTWGNPKTECGFFEFVAGTPPQKFADALNSLAKRPPQMQPEGIYVTLNPVNPALLARADNRLKAIRDKPISATDEDVTTRRVFLVDADPTRPGGISATDEEKAAAKLVFDGVREDLRARGWPPPMLNDSGNGYHGWYRIDLPRDDGKKVERALKALAARHNTKTATLDTSVFNPSRIAKIPGTWARKGDSRPDRPHRMARVLEVPGAVEIVPAALIEALAGETTAPKVSESIGRPGVGKLKVKVTSGKCDPVSRCRAYLAAVPGGVQGEHGSDQTFKAARIVWNDFGIDEAEGYPLLQEWNKTCKPEWPEDGPQGLKRKWSEAVAAGPGSEGRGYKLHEQNGKHTNGDGKAHKSGPGPTPADFTDTDIANGRAFVANHGEDVRFVADWGQWVAFDGRRWEVDRSETIVERLAKETAAQLATDAAEQIAKLAIDMMNASTEDERKAIKAAQHKAQQALMWAKHTQDMRAVRRMLQAARSESAICIAKGGDVFDARRDLLNCPNGTVELRTGTLREHRREDYITRLCPTRFDPNAPRTEYLAFLAKVFDGKPKVATYVRELSGYAITGEVSDQTLQIFNGDGSNGKGVLIDLWTLVLGESEYAHTAAAELLVNDGWDRHPTEKTGLRGARLVVCSETGEDGALDESKMKALTGGDTITARFMRADFFQFTPTHKLILATNHRPRIRGTDHAVWRRLRLVPFAVRFWKDADKDLDPKGDYPERFKADQQLGGRLRTEAAGVLADMVTHAVAFYRAGGVLNPPSEVTAATTDYRKAEDVIGQFFDARVDKDEKGKVKAADFYAAFKKWWEDEGYTTTKVPSPTKFGREAKRRFDHDRPSGITYRVEVLTEDKPQQSEATAAAPEQPSEPTPEGTEGSGHFPDKSRAGAREWGVNPKNASDPPYPPDAPPADPDPAEEFERRAIDHESEDSP